MAYVHQHSAQQRSQQAYWLSLVALFLALLATGGSLFLSLVLGLQACPLCFYQRSFAMSVFAVLLIGLSTKQTPPALLSLLAFPLAVAGLGVAIFHEYLVWTGVLECPKGIFGLGTAPAQSLVLFALLAPVLAIGAISKTPERNRRIAGTTGAGALGLVLAWSSIASSPPLPSAPTAPYDPVKQPLDMCRPPHAVEDGPERS